MNREFHQTTGQSVSDEYFDQTGDDTPAFRQLFSSLFMPGGTKEQLEKFAERQRKTTTAECAFRYFETTRNIDVSDLLPKVTVPTLVMHVRGDQVQPFEAGRELAAGILWLCRDKITSPWSKTL